MDQPTKIERFIYKSFISLYNHLQGTRLELLSQVPPPYTAMSCSSRVRPFSIRSCKSWWKSTEKTNSWADLPKVAYHSISFWKLIWTNPSVSGANLLLVSGMFYPHVSNGIFIDPPPKKKSKWQLPETWTTNTAPEKVGWIGTTRLVDLTNCCMLKNMRYRQIGSSPHLDVPSDELVTV